VKLGPRGTSGMPLRPVFERLPESAVL